MGINYLWDTNMVIYFLQQQFPPATEKFIDNVLKSSAIGISVITEIELLCWKTATEKDLDVIQRFIAEVSVFELDQEIKLTTASIRRKNKIKLPDAIIAATALRHELTLLTRNSRDFAAIAKLNLIDPFTE